MVKSNFSFSRGPIVPSMTKLTVPAFQFLFSQRELRELIPAYFMAGKRNKQIKLAQASATLSEYSSFDLARTLNTPCGPISSIIYYPAAIGESL